LSAGRRSDAAQMTRWGYVVFVVDSFATRGIKEACDQHMPDRQSDAVGALIYLSRLDFIDPRRVALVGYSQGAIVALQLASPHPPGLFEIPNELDFKAAVAFYPECRFASDKLTLPTLILIGELDDWAPAEECKHLMQRQSGKGALLKLSVYPGAYHAFDSPALREGVRSYGHWLKYVAQAAENSIAETRGFLASNLAPN
jgi:dienelactone hydrolase